MAIKTILITNNHLENLGGSETYTYTMIKEFCRKGYEVEYFTFHKGLVSEKIEKDLGVYYMSKLKYDIIFANHNTTVEYLMKRVEGKIIQTCHGIYPPLEQPYKYADAHISISSEVNEHISTLGYTSKTILNGIDLQRYKPTRPINSTLPRKILSLCQSESANELISEACKDLSIEFQKLDKNINPLWSIEKEINKSDLVIGIGRSAYEAMACGRPVIIFDSRSYSQSYADGYLTSDRIESSILNNCSGRRLKLDLNKKTLINEINKYNPDDGYFLRYFAEKSLNIDIATDEYIEFANNIDINPLNRKRFKRRMFLKKLKSIFKVRK